MDANEIRRKYLEFMKRKGHVVIAPARLVLEDDPTTLFTGSGMQPLLPYLLGREHPDGVRLTDSQPCMRLQDIEDVGDPRHTTVFEMLGNWSLGDYFKEEQIRGFFEFLTAEVGLKPEKLYVTCFMGDEGYGIPRDDEAAEIWQKVFEEAGVEAGIAEIGSAKEGDTRGIRDGERIFFYDDKENWWSRGGGIETTPIGDPCGPDSEVFYDFGAENQDEEKFGKAHPASDGARFMEIGNQVFMQYRRLPDGSFEELAKKNVDFGGGLERITAASLDSYDVFRISLLKPIIEKIEELTGKKYESNTSEMRIVADHLRGAYLLAAQGLVPSNKQQGYALRRLMRRAILKAWNLGIEQDFLAEVLSVIARNYEGLSDEILTHRGEVVAVLTQEEKAFRQAIRKGLREFDNVFAKPIEEGNVIVSNGEATDRSSHPNFGHGLFRLFDTYGFPVELSIEELYRRYPQVKELLSRQELIGEFNKEMAEQRERSKTASKGMFKGGLEDHGEQTVRYHTAAHLLLAAMQKLIDPKIEQRGANITAERLRFDFGIERKLEAGEIVALEKQVNEWIGADLPVVSAEFDKAYARDVLKAHGQFWERYPEKVTVYTIGDEADPVSREICGGPHVKRTGEIGKFKIVKEESSARGVRRIKAVLEQGD